MRPFVEGAKDGSSVAHGASLDVLGAANRNPLERRGAKDPPPFPPKSASLAHGARHAYASSGPRILSSQ
ncbi:hypothetical protein GCM10012319_16580 [Comamonas sp. KCTC 72670]|nr:hypothetical protein GCM10012319_16580 [Comamonas sp. KCTC 72670]